MSAETLRWFPATPGNLPDTARTVLLWTPPTHHTCGAPGVFMGWLQGGKLRFCDPRIESDTRHPRPSAWAEMPAGPASGSSAPLASVFVWNPHCQKVKPLPEGVPVLAVQTDGLPRIVRLDETGYHFDYFSGDDLKPENILYWGHLPAVPHGPARKEEASA